MTERMGNEGAATVNAGETNRETYQELTENTRVRGNSPGSNSSETHQELTGNSPKLIGILPATYRQLNGISKNSGATLWEFGPSFGPSASVDNTLLVLQDFSYPTQLHSIIANYSFKIG